MKKYINISIVFLFLMFAGCNDFDEINVNPNAPTEVPSGLLLADVLRITMNTYYSTFIGGDMGLCWSQHWTKVQYNEEERYIVRENVLESVWDNFYSGVIQDARRMQQLAAEEGNENNQGVALVVQAFGFLTLTDLYGAIPFSEALGADDGNFTPAFDSQRDIYASVIEWLDQANTLLATDNGEMNVNTDLLFGGSVDHWRMFANSLQFRALMRISSVGDAPVDVSAKLTELMGRDMITSNDDEAKMDYLSAQPNANPIYESITAGNRDEYRINTTLFEILNKYGEGEYDPRVEVFAVRNEDGEFRGKPSGIDPVPNAEYDKSNVSFIGAQFLVADYPGTFMSYSELAFLMAEAVVRGLIPGDAGSYYDAGIIAHFATVGLSDEYATYAAHPTVPLSTNPTTGLRQIAEQKWLALYGQGIEAWTETRRTGIPELQPAIQGVLGGELPMRYTWPLIELSLNATGVAGGVALQGDNLLTTNIWWLN